MARERVAVLREWLLCFRFRNFLFVSRRFIRQGRSVSSESSGCSKETSSHSSESSTANTSSACGYSTGCMSLCLFAFDCDSLTSLDLACVCVCSLLCLNLIIVLCHLLSLLLLSRNVHRSNRCAQLVWEILSAQSHSFYWCLGRKERTSFSSQRWWWCCWTWKTNGIEITQCRVETNLLHSRWSYRKQSSCEIRRHR